MRFAFCAFALALPVIGVTFAVFARSANRGNTAFSVAVFFAGWLVAALLSSRCERWLCRKLGLVCPNCKNALVVGKIRARRVLRTKTCPDCSARIIED